jgi:type IV pilus assembly protein PilA
MIKSILNKKGVTLVELLAVVVILGIIAAIAVPTIGGLIRRQEANAAEATYDTIVAAAELYAEDDTTPFNLETLVNEEFIDLKDNDFGWTEGAIDVDASEVWIVVSGTTVSFYQATDVNTSGTSPVLNTDVTADSLYINGYEGNPVE